MCFLFGWLFFFTGKYTAYKDIEKKINKHLTIVKKYYYVMSFDF